MVLNFDFHQQILKKRIIDTFEYEGEILLFKPFQANVPILHPLKTPRNQSFSSVFRGFKMEALGINCLNFWYNIYPEIINWN